MKRLLTFAALAALLGGCAVYTPYPPTVDIEGPAPVYGPPPPCCYAPPPPPCCYGPPGGIWFDFHGGHRGWHGYGGEHREWHEFHRRWR